MKNKLLFIVLGVAFSLGAQTPLSTSNCSVTLTISGSDGTNGVAVAYNPKNNLYYTVFAGNSVYPIETHSINGTSIDSQESGFDSRGMWYNAKKNCIEGISYSNAGSVEIVLDASGKINGTKESSFSYGMDAQSVAVYAEKKKAIMFVEGNMVYFFKPGTTKPKTLTLDVPSDLELNTNGPAYTGVKNYEIALMEAGKAVVHLFNAKTGKETGKVTLNSNTLPEEMEMPYSFRVSYTNNLLFLFDVNSRTWSGFRLF